MSESTTDRLASLLQALESNLPLPDFSDCADFAKLVRYHGIAPLLLELDCDNRIPALRRSELRELARAEFVFASEDDRMLREILQHWHHQQIPYLLMKGAALERTVYDRIGLRPRSDIDLLVPEDCFAKAQTSLVELGYVRQPLTGAGTSAAMMLVRGGRFGLQHVVDLHYRVSSQAHPYSLAQAFAPLSARAAVCRDGWSVLSCVDALLLALFHRAQHFTTHGERLIWLYDIRLLIGQLDVGERRELARQAVTMKIGSALNHAMAACEKCFAVDHGLSAVPEDESSALFTLDEDKGQVSRIALSLANTPGTLPQVRFLYSRLFPPVQFARQHYGVSIQMLPVFYIGRLCYALKLLPSFALRVFASKRENS